MFTFCLASCRPESGATVSATSQTGAGGDENIITPTVKAEQLKDGSSTVRFEGISGFDGFLAQGGATSGREAAEYLPGLVAQDIFFGGQLFGCSAISVPSANGGYLFGRNFDWETCNAMIAQSVPGIGDKPISTVNTDFISIGGVDLQKLPGKAQMLISLYDEYLPGLLLGRHGRDYTLAYRRCGLSVMSFVPHFW